MYSNFFGAAASGMCAIHCAVTPLFFAAKPVLEGTTGGHAHGSLLWGALDYVFLVLSFVAVWLSTQHTSTTTHKRALWGFWAVFAIGLFCEPFELAFGIWLMYAGSIGLVITHWMNYRHCEACKDNVAIE